MKILNSDKGTIFSALALAMGVIGDAFLYPVLPIYAPELGLSALWVGILLSANRFVRIFANTLVAFWIKQVGYKQSIIWASVIAAFTTLVYGWSMGVWVFLAARLGWGIAFSVFRIGTLSYAGMSAKKGWSFGLSNGINALGGSFGLLIGPLLLTYFGYSWSVTLLGLFSFMGLYFAFSLPHLPVQAQNLSLKRIGTPSLIAIILLVFSTCIDGILVVIVGKIVGSAGMNNATIVALAGAYLLFRKLNMVVVAPFAGRIADRFGLAKVFGISLLLTCISVGCLSLGYTVIGLLGAFLFQNISQSLGPAVAVEGKEKEKLNILTQVTTYVDVGMAIGALIGLKLFYLLGPDHLLWLILVAILIPMLFFFFKRQIKSQKIAIEKLQ